MTNENKQLLILIQRSRKELRAAGPPAGTLLRQVDTLEKVLKSGRMSIDDLRSVEKASYSAPPGLIESVRGPATTEEGLSATHQLIVEIQKTIITLGKK